MFGVFVTTHGGQLVPEGIIADAALRRASSAVVHAFGFSQAISDVLEDKGLFNCKSIEFGSLQRTHRCNHVRSTLFRECVCLSSLLLGFICAVGRTPWVAPRAMCSASCGIVSIFLWQRLLLLNAERLVLHLSGLATWKARDAARCFSGTEDIVAEALSLAGCTNLAKRHADLVPGDVQPKLPATIAETAITILRKLRASLVEQGLIPTAQVASDSSQQECQQALTDNFSTACLRAELAEVVALRDECLLRLLALRPSSCVTHGVFRLLEFENNAKAWLCRLVALLDNMVEAGLSNGEGIASNKSVGMHVNRI